MNLYTTTTKVENNPDYNTYYNYTVVFFIPGTRRPFTHTFFGYVESTFTRKKATRFKNQIVYILHQLGHEVNRKNLRFVHTS